jgi:TRAP-type uncharacterized transport system fused permease subunit
LSHGGLISLLAVVLTGAAIALLVLFLEGLRRTSGGVLFYTTLAFIALAMFGGSLPGEFAARSIPLPRLAYYLVWDSSAILGIAIKIIATVVVVYVFSARCSSRRAAPPSSPASRWR